VIRLDAATVLLQWSTGGLLFLWVTTRRRLLGIGYGWLLRSVYAVMALGALAAGASATSSPARDGFAALEAAAAVGALAVSILRRKAGVSGHRLEKERRAVRVAVMTAGSNGPVNDNDGAGGTASGSDRDMPVTGAGGTGPEFPPGLDLVAPVLGCAGLVAAGLAAGGSPLVAVLRTLAGAAFLGAVSDAMLLGHWYLVQPGLRREPLIELTRWAAVLWPVEVAGLLLPTGMISVLAGTVDDGWQGTLGWFWVACAVTTLVLTFVTRAALRERSYSAVMAATGLLYLAILTAFGTDLVARAVLAG